MRRPARDNPPGHVLRPTTLHKVELSYSLAARRSPSDRIRNPLMDLLHAVREQGSISSAARSLDLSYRHVWGELKRWEAQLGRPLIIWEKGQAAQLSEFGDKLLWAERQAQARLSAQIAALHADLERAFAVAFDDNTHVLAFHASHDDALAQLRAHTAATGLQLDIQFTGSVDAISALNQGRCTMAGFHTLEQPATGSLAQRTYQPLLTPGLHKVIGFARRSQGLIVAPGNPLGLASLADVQRKAARFVNRPLGTGTRVLLDELLEREGIDASGLQGYERTEPSHAAVAHAIASGQADAGLGLQSAAYAQQLDFVPLVQERYHLVCLKSTLEQPATQALLAVLRSPTWQHLLGTLPGYAAADSGEVQALHRLLPWWNFNHKKGSARP